MISSGGCYVPATLSFSLLEIISEIGVGALEAVDDLQGLAGGFDVGLKGAFLKLIFYILERSVEVGFRH